MQPTAPPDIRASGASFFGLEQSNAMAFKS